MLERRQGRLVFHAALICTLATLPLHHLLCLSSLVISLSAAGSLCYRLVHCQMSDIHTNQQNDLHFTRLEC